MESFGMPALIELVFAVMHFSNGIEVNELFVDALFCLVNMITECDVHLLSDHISDPDTRNQLLLCLTRALESPQKT